MTAQQREEYFRDGLQYFKECYPDYKILDASIHRDEGYFDNENKWNKGLDHLQICAIPLYYNKEKNQYEISTTKAEKDHLIREMEKEGRSTSHVDLREQRQYLHDKFVDYNREHGRNFDYKSREGHQNRLSVKLYKKIKDKEKELDKEKEKQLENERQQRRTKRALEKKEKDLDNREKEQNKYDKYFETRDRFLEIAGLNEYEYVKAVKGYEKTGDPVFSYFDAHGSYSQAVLIPEITNPSRSDEERKQLNIECHNFNDGKEVHLIKERERLETKTHEKEKDIYR